MRNCRLTEGQSGSRPTNMNGGMQPQLSANAIVVVDHVPGASEYMVVLKIHINIQINE